MSVDILPATTERFDDAEHTLTGGGDGASCQCQWWTLTNADFQKTSLDERTELLRQQLGDDPAPALIAYVDGEPAAWVRIGPRTTQARILRTKAIISHSTEQLDDPDVWAISCFAVRKEHRGRGLGRSLIDAAVEHARAHGARVVEAYPVDPTAGKKKSSNALYHGVLSTFEDAGFDVIARPKDDTAIVSLTLGG
jgi:ribosomal protein S18 acetylase RimI-like enzyme